MSKLFFDKIKNVQDNAVSIMALYGEIADASLAAGEEVDLVEIPLDDARPRPAILRGTEVALSNQPAYVRDGILLTLVLDNFSENTQKQVVQGLKDEKDSLAKMEDFKSSAFYRGMEKTALQILSVFQPQSV